MVRWSGIVDSLESTMDSFLVLSDTCTLVRRRLESVYRFVLLYGVPSFLMSHSLSLPVYVGDEDWQRPKVTVCVIMGS